MDTRDYLVGRKTPPKGDNYLDRPNHFTPDILGDPNTCDELHNHPVGDFFHATRREHGADFVDSYSNPKLVADTPTPGKLKAETVVQWALTLTFVAILVCGVADIVRWTFW